MARDRIGVRDLRNRGGEVIARVQAGERLLVTKSGRPVAELGPLGHKALNSTELLARWRSVPAVDLKALREDLDSALDPLL